MATAKKAEVITIKPVEVMTAEKYSVLLRQAYAELVAFQRKYESLKELVPVLEAMKEVV